jgi:shikimate kinase
MDEQKTIETVRTSLKGRAIVLVGLMGCGKSAVGKRLAGRLALPFVDADEEIERVADKSINEIFTDHGEDYFRNGERRVIARLLGNGAQVLATGGGAFINPETRASIKERGVSIWLRAELPVLMRRVMKRDTRPLLKTADPEAVMRDLMAKRYPIYAEADITVESREVPHDTIVTEVLASLRKHFELTDAPAAHS